MLGSGGGLRRPWLWALSFFLSGGNGVTPAARYPLKRVFLAMYWAGVLIVAVGGWQTRLVRARRIRMRSASGSARTATTGKVREGPKVAAELAREEKSFHASLNMRRKFFHALAVALFVPGIAVDVSPPSPIFRPAPVVDDPFPKHQAAFTSLAFSVAFSLFTFCEYARFFALYPVGAPLHIFFTDFVDSKDSGPVILSHFYLLTGCAGGLWLEGRGVNRYTGVLVLGVGDALVSSRRSFSRSNMSELTGAWCGGGAGFDRGETRGEGEVARHVENGRRDDGVRHLDALLRLAPPRHGPHQ